MSNDDGKAKKLLKEVWSMTYSLDAKRKLAEAYELVFEESIIESKRKTKVLDQPTEPLFVEDAAERAYAEPYTVKDKHPKWMLPSTDFQKRVLEAAHRKYWPSAKEGGKEQRSKIIMIEKSMSIISIKYPSNWIEHCLQWYESKNKTGYVPLQGLVTFIEDEDKRNVFLAKEKAARGSSNAASVADGDRY